MKVGVKISFIGRPTETIRDLNLYENNTIERINVPPRKNKKGRCNNG